MVVLPFLSSAASMTCFLGRAAVTSTTRMMTTTLHQQQQYSAVSAFGQQLPRLATTMPTSSSTTYSTRSFHTTTTTQLSMQMNCNDALKKQDETLTFDELMSKDVTTLQGIGPVHQGQLADLRIKTIADLAHYKFFHLARAIVTLAEVEEAGGRKVEAGDEDEAVHQMNLNKGLDKAYETMPLKELTEAPVAALQGLTDTAGETWKALGVKTIGELADCKYCKWAQALETAAKFEE